VGTAQKSTSLRVCVASFAAVGGKARLLSQLRCGCNALRLLAKCGAQSDGTVIADLSAN